MESTVKEVGKSDGAGDGDRWELSLTGQGKLVDNVPAPISGGYSARRDDVTTGLPKNLRRYSRKSPFNASRIFGTPYVYD